MYVGDLTPFEFFKQEASNADVVIRTEAMENAGYVAAVMTPESVRADLIPFLLARTVDSDQVLVHMARNIGQMLRYMGGESHANLLIPIAEKLLLCEETVVRTAAAKSMCRLLAQMRANVPAGAGEAYYSEFVALLKRLTSEEHGELFYSRVSAAQFCTDLYDAIPQDNPDKLTVMEVFLNLCKDDLAIVRRAATAVLPKFISHCSTQVLLNEVMALLNTLSSDENQIVKANNVASYVYFTETIAAKDSLTQVSHDLLTLIKAACDDTSWKIRLALTKNFDTFAKNFPEDLAKTDLFVCYVNLLHDSESDVRIMACSCGLEYLRICGVEAFLADVVPIALIICDDANPVARRALADLCVGIACKIGPEIAPQHMNDLVVKCLSDEEPSVRLRVVTRLPEIASSIPNLCTRITPDLRNLCLDDHWRVRQELVRALPAIIKHMGCEYFIENFLECYLEALKDLNAEVRLTAAKILVDVVASAGASWVFDRIFPTIKTMSTMEYQIRMNMIVAINVLLSGETNDRFQSALLSLLLASASDPVANIRIMAAQAMASIHTSMQGKECGADIVPMLTELEADRDKDVKYFATEAKKLYIS